MIAELYIRPDAETETDAVAVRGEQRRCPDNGMEFISLVSETNVSEELQLGNIRGELDLVLFYDVLRGRVG